MHERNGVLESSCSFRLNVATFLSQDTTEADDVANVAGISVAARAGGRCGRSRSALDRAGVGGQGQGE